MDESGPSGRIRDRVFLFPLIRALPRTHVESSTRSYGHVGDIIDGKYLFPLGSATELGQLFCSTISQFRGLRFRGRLKDTFRMEESCSRPYAHTECVRCYSAFFGQFLTHSMHRMHSVPFSRLRESSSMSTSIGHTRRHLPHSTHLPWSHVILSSEK